MSGLSGLEIGCWTLLGLGAIYLAARLATAAYFISKQQHEERRKNHG